MEVAQISLLVLILGLPFFDSVKCINDRPIIGIIAKESRHPKDLPLGKSLITASYVKFLEAGGARVVPIMIRKSQDYYEDLIGKINGVLYPGGGVSLSSDGYGRTASIVYDIAVKLNDKGDFFPLWGTCLGFEELHFLAAGRKDWRTPCLAKDWPSQLDLVKDFDQSRIYKNADKSLVYAMTHENVLINYHKCCLTRQNYALSGLDKFFKILSTSQDSRNETFISSVEAYNYPFYGVASHPEKILFEWPKSESHQKIPHTRNAGQVSQFFANFFVDEARKNSHRFPSKRAEDEVLIYEFQPTFIGKSNRSIMQNYYFE